MRRILSLALCALMSFGILASCSKQGPAGPAGPSGSTNVIVSAWTNSFSGTSADWQVSAITQGVLDSSAVLVYYLEGEIVRLLPYIDVDGGYYVQDDVTLGEIDLSCGSNQDLSQYSFRYVIIPASMAGTGISRSYEQMMAKLGIAP